MKVIFCIAAASIVFGAPVVADTIELTNKDRRLRGHRKLTVAPSFASGNLVQNGSFEEGQTHSSGYVITSNIPGWTSTSGNMEVCRKDFEGVPSKHGNYFLELDVYDAGKGIEGVYQNIDTEQGEQYYLRFSVNSRGNDITSDDNAVVVGWDNKKLNSGFKTKTAGEWTEYSVMVTGTGKPTQLLFRESTIRSTNNGKGAFLDKVQLYKVESPKPPGVASGNLVKNGSFEEDQSHSGYSVISSIPGWTSTSGNVEVWRTDFYDVPSKHGNYFVELDVYGSSRGIDGVYQYIYTEQGQQYHLRFYVRSRGSDVTTDNNAVVVVWDGKKLNSGFKPKQAGEWTEYNVMVTGTGKPTQLLFRESIIQSANNGKGAFLDAVQLYKVSNRPLPHYEIPNKERLGLELQAGIDRLSETGGTIFVPSALQGGIYDTTVSLTRTRGTKQIVITTSDGNRFEIGDGRGDGKRRVFHLDSVNDLTVENLHVRPSGDFLLAGWINVSAIRSRNISFNNVISEHAKWFGFALEICTNVKFTSTITQGQGFHGMRFASMNNLIMSNIDVRNIGSYGLGFKGTLETSKGVELYDITLTNVKSDGIDYKGPGWDKNNDAAYERQEKPYLIIDGLTSVRDGSSVSPGTPVIDMRVHSKVSNVNIKVKNGGVGVRFRGGGFGSLSSTQLTSIDGTGRGMVIGFAPIAVKDVTFNSFDNEPISLYNDFSIFDGDVTFRNTKVDRHHITNSDIVGGSRPTFHFT